MSDEAEQVMQPNAAMSAADQMVDQANGAAGGGKPNLEAIMHVPLEVSVELGRVQMPLHVVARLHRGTVIDLKKEANTEVEIFANGRVFARGEVVSADGKLGVRVLEIVPAGDRIRSLG